MTVLRESPWYQEILKEGLQQGLQEGLQQGEASVIIRLLTQRLGTLDASVTLQIRSLSLSQLEALAEIFLNFSSLTDLYSWLAQQQ